RLAEMVKIFLRGHAWPVPAVFRNWIGNLNRVRKATFFCGQRISRFELQWITVRVTWLRRVLGTPFRQLLHGCVEPLRDRLFFEQPRRTIGNHYPNQAQHQQPAHPTCCSHVSLSPWWSATQNGSISVP